MSRFTLITTTVINRKSVKRAQFGKGINCLCTSLEKYKGMEKCICREILPGIFVILSNGLNREDHYELYKKIKEVYPGSRVISVTHKNPLYAIIKASKLASQTDFYYEEGVEENYYIGIFTLTKYSGDIVVDLAFVYSSVFNITTFLLHSGSLPLDIRSGEIIAVLNKNIIDQLDLIKSRVNVKVGVDYYAREALEKSIAQSPNNY